MRDILLLKLKRIYRELLSMPILCVLLFIIAIVVLAIAYLQLNKTPNSYILALVVTLIIYLIHNTREDVEFCRLMLKTPQILFFIEYTLICSPLIILSIVAESYQNTLFYCILPLAFSIVPRVTPNSFLQKRLYFFGVTSLELVAFIRRYFLLILFLIALSIITCFVHVLPICILLIVLIIFNDAYAENEPLNILLLEELSPQKIIRTKIKEGVILFLKLSLPTLIIYTLFNFETAYLVLILPVIAYIAISLFVGIKYSFYESNNSKTSLPMAGVGIIGLIIPVFLPVTIILAISYCIKAEDNLNHYICLR